jgi:hypothetical protein
VKWPVLKTVRRPVLRLRAKSKEPFEQQCTYHALNVKLAAISDVLPPDLVRLSQRA